MWVFWFKKYVYNSFSNGRIYNNDNYKKIGNTQTSY